MIPGINCGAVGESSNTSLADAQILNPKLLHTPYRWLLIDLSSYSNGFVH